MKNRPDLAIAIATITAVLSLIFSIYSKLSTPKVAYIRTLDVIYKYNGMKMAHARFKKQSEEWQANIDTLKNRYNVAVANYQIKAKSTSGKALEEDKLMLDRMEADYKKYASAIGEKAQENEKKITEEVLNQVNAFVEDYAKKNGYDIVLGAEGGGTIMYGNDKFDITEEVLKKLNEDYKELP